MNPPSLRHSILAGTMLATLFQSYTGHTSPRYSPRSNPTITDTDWIAIGSSPYFNGKIAKLLVGSDGTLYAGGKFSIAGGTPAVDIAKWDGSKWCAFEDQIRGTPPTISAFTIDKNGTLYIYGAFASTGASPADSIAKWSGTTWVTLDRGVDPINMPSGKITYRNDFVSSIAIDSSGNLYAGGRFHSASGIIVKNIAKWNENGWQNLGDGIASPTYVTLPVTTLLIDKSQRLIAGGRFDSAGTIRTANIAMWDGKTWSSMASGSPEFREVTSLTMNNTGKCFVSSIIDDALSVTGCDIEGLEGSTWSPLSSGINGLVHSLAVDNNNNLYAAGVFDSAGGKPIKNLAVWNGSHWGSIGNGIDFIAGAVTIDTVGNVYVASTDTAINSTDRYDVSLWNGTVWSVLSNNGNGINGHVKTLAVDKSGAVYAGGIFSIRLHLTTASEVTMRLFMLSGREIYRSTGKMAVGQHTLRIAKPEIGAGTYLIRVTTGTVSMCGKIVVNK